jgi:plasmid replication initiation protein
MDKTYLVTKSNYFIMNSSYDLSLEEQKIILTLASMVQPTDEEFKPYKFKINEFMELLGVNTKTKYTEIPKITKELMKKVFEIEEGNKLIQTAWLSGAIYEKGTGCVELAFSPYLKPYMLQLKEKFTQYQLANILTMKSKYSPKIYEILKCNEFKSQKYIELEIKELRKLLKIENMYPLYADFKRKIILHAQKELKKLTDIDFEFEEIKTGRKVTALKFYIRTNKSKLAKDLTVDSNEEVSATSTEIEEGNPIKKVLAIMGDHKITTIEAIKIYDSSKGNIDVISKVYNHFKNKKANNFIGLLIAQVRPGVFKEDKKNYNKGVFNDFLQHGYTPEQCIDMEKKLLGD